MFFVVVLFNCSFICVQLLILKSTRCLFIFSLPFFYLLSFFFLSVCLSFCLLKNLIVQFVSLVEDFQLLSQQLGPIPSPTPSLIKRKSSDAPAACISKSSFLRRTEFMCTAFEPQHVTNQIQVKTFSSSHNSATWEIHTKQNILLHGAIFSHNKPNLVVRDTALLRKHTQYAVHIIGRLVKVYPIRAGEIWARQQRHNAENGFIMLCDEELIFLMSLMIYIDSVINILKVYYNCADHITYTGKPTPNRFQSDIMLFNSDSVIFCSV